MYMTKFLFLNKTRIAAVAAIGLMTAILLLSGCSAGYPGGEVTSVSWDEYRELISRIEQTADAGERELLLHRAEDILMKTGAILPIYYPNDPYLLRGGVQGFYAVPNGRKFFTTASYPGHDVLRLCLGPEPGTLDPAMAGSIEDVNMMSIVFEGLYTYGPDGGCVPALAESCTVSEDQLTYSFTLRDGLAWSDGAPLDANDFVYSWNRAVDPALGAPLSYFLSVVDGFDDIWEAGEGSLNISASDDGRIFTVTLSSPCAYFIDICTMSIAMPVQRAAAEGDLWAAGAGFPSCGGYVVESWRHGESIVLVRNPSYWNASAVGIPRLELALSADSVNNLIFYRAGNLDFMTEFPTDELAALSQAGDLYVDKTIGTSYAFFNVRSRMFAGKTAEEAATVRRALALLIDRQRIVDDCIQTGDTLANTFVADQMWVGDGLFKRNTEQYTYPLPEEAGYFSTVYSDDAVRKAVSMLESVGYKFKDGKLSGETPLSFEFLTNNSAVNEAIAQCIQQDFAVIGIKMAIRTCDWIAFWGEIDLGDFDMARMVWLADYSDPINMLEVFAARNDCKLGE